MRFSYIVTTRITVLFVYTCRLIFKWRITNGGYLIYIDRESWKTDKAIRVSLNGRTLSRSYTFQWDLIDPYHECVITNSKCSDPPVKTTDVTEMVSKTWYMYNTSINRFYHIRKAKILVSRFRDLNCICRKYFAFHLLNLSVYECYSRSASRMLN